ncbi:MULTISPECIES: iron uptake protein [unclassified Cupriavidus]|uniref:iron uptake protein n=1 Tax=unclassified Cupriavidus TaxID=2640874 RepID=UPI001AE2C0C2|nr:MULTISPECIES: iron uptake protein [unclassified Cupriavidus]MBP0631471.1 iron uptake protein [Cupriavidus sp. AcVe19-1a]MBP0637139.1 iron uptake protein [Cupriavidus sp. AcVe19-6a]
MNDSPSSLPSRGAIGPALAMTVRALAALAGSYAFTWGITAGGAVLGWRLGLPRSEAVLWFSMLAFLLFPLMSLWALVTRRLWRVWLVLLAGAAIGAGVAQWLGERLA